MIATLEFNVKAIKIEPENLEGFELTFYDWNENRFEQSMYQIQIDDNYIICDLKAIQHDWVPEIDVFTSNMELWLDEEQHQLTADETEYLHIQIANAINNL